MSNLIPLFSKELENEAVTTRKMLERVPDDKFDWKPHPKSMSLRQLATHVAELPSWIGMILNTDELDFANNPYEPVPVKDRSDLLSYYEKNLADARVNLANGKEDKLSNPWTLRNGDQIYDVSPKADVIRMSLSQTIHHRAQLGVFLRLLDVPIPGSYGPSADDMAH